MRILVIGATGPTGSLVVREALAAGHTVTALVREPGRIDDAPGVKEVVADVREPHAFETALTDQDAVICALGHVPDSPVNLCSTATGRLLEGMEAKGVSRLVLVTGAMIGHPREKLPWSYRLIETLLPAKDKARIEDRRTQEKLIQASRVGWTIVRAPWLKDGPALGQVHTGTDLPLGMTASVRRADLARWMVRAAADPALAHTSLAITN